MKNSFKSGSHFKNVCLLVVLSLLVFGCSESPSNFTEFLYELAEIDEQDRNENLNKWLNKQEEFPVIDGNDVYFIYKQKKETPVFLMGDMNCWDPKSIPLLKIVGTEYYYVRRSYPMNSGLEYLYKVGNKLLLDPLNKKIIKDKGKQASVLFMHDYQYPQETLLHRDHVYTTLDTITYNGHDLYLYKNPAAFKNAPLIIFLNGKEYLKFAQAHVILDNLIRDKQITSCSALFVPADLNFKTLIPFIKKKYNLSGNKIIVGGTENAGVSSLLMLKDRSLKIYGVFLQSGLANMDSLDFLPEINNMDLLKNRIFIANGYFEKKDPLYSRLVKSIQNKTANIKYVQYNEGASWLSWKGHLDDALIYLLKPKENP